MYFLHYRELGRRPLLLACANGNRNLRHMNKSGAVDEILHLIVYETTLTKAIFRPRSLEVLVVWQTKTGRGTHLGTCHV